jgi:ABC-type branched-subunit amino acid transport system ATPase component
MKTCIFIVGDRGSGKTSTVKSLTGCSRNGLWTVRDLRNRSVRAFVLLSAVTEFGGEENPPDEFPSP